MVRYEIEVVEATGLPAADLGGTSDPFLEVCTGTGRQKTDTKKKTLSPVWREKKIVDIVTPMKDAVGFIVYDWDRVGANDMIAYGYISVMNVPLNGMPLDVWVELYKRGKRADKANKKTGESGAKTGKPPKPAIPGGRLHLVVRCLDVQAAPMMMPPQPMPGQPYYPPQGMPGQPMPGQPMPGQPYYPPQPMPGQPMPGQPYYPPQPMPGQPMPMGAPMAAPMGAPMVAPGMNPLQIQSPYTGVIPSGFQNKSGFLRPKKTDAEIASKTAGKGAKKTLKFLGKALLS